MEIEGSGEGDIGAHDNLYIRLSSGSNADMGLSEHEMRNGRQSTNIFLSNLLQP
jgi:hypothetical protein